MMLASLCSIFLKPIFKCHSDPAVAGEESISAVLKFTNPFAFSVRVATARLEFRLQAASFQFVTSRRGPAKAGTPNSVSRLTKNHGQRFGKPQHDNHW